jgi:hypothetical protein
MSAGDGTQTLRKGNVLTLEQCGAKLRDIGIARVTGRSSHSCIKHLRRNVLCGPGNNHHILWGILYMMSTSAERDQKFVQFTWNSTAPTTSPL